MDNDVVLLQRTRAWLMDGVLEPSYQAYLTYLIGRGYSSWSIRKYSCCVAHFAYWLRKRRAILSQIDEALIRYFLDEHLPQCDCPLRTPRSRNHVRQALKHLLVVLRQRADISRRPDITPRWIQGEIREFDAHLDQVCGLAASTEVTHAHRTDISVGTVRCIENQYGAGQAGTCSSICRESPRRMQAEHRQSPWDCTKELLAFPGYARRSRPEPYCRDSANRPVAVRIVTRHAI
jgi:hypothetical protein